MLTRSHKAFRSALKSQSTSDQKKTSSEPTWAIRGGYKLPKKVLKRKARHGITIIKFRSECKVETQMGRGVRARGARIPKVKKRGTQPMIESCMAIIQDRSLDALTSNKSKKGVGD